MGNPRAKATVVLRDPETGTVRVFEQGDQLTDWAMEEITNPEVYAAGDDDSDDSDAAGGDDSEEAPANSDEAPPADAPKPKRATRTRRTAAKTAAK
jgi:D-alanyl-D-alanine carboxypeptidase